MKKIVVGEGSCGIAAGAAKVYSAIEPLIEGSGIELKITGCIGMCYLEPIVDVYEGDALVQRLVRVSEKDAQAVVDAVKSGDFSGVEELKILEEDKKLKEAHEKLWAEARKRKTGNCAYIPPKEAYAIIDEYYGITPQVIGQSTQPAERTNVLDLF